MYSSDKSLKAAMTGRRNKYAGETWEDIIGTACVHYSETGEAEIEKTPEPMRPLRKMPNGQFVAVYTKSAQPDYKGTLSGGQSIVFEAKHTDTDRMKRSVITEEQEKRLDNHQKCGAICFVLVSFGFNSFFRVPWTVFKNMKEHYGRKYVTKDDLVQFSVRYENGVLRFLDYVRKEHSIWTS